MIAVRVLPLVAVLLIAPPAVAAQEPALPDGVVAKVADELIPKSEFDRWLAGSALATYGRRGAYDPPEFERCVQAKLRRTPRGSRPPRRRALRRTCRLEYRTVRDSVMEYLLESTWTRQEAAAHEIVAPEEHVRRRLERAKRAAFDSEREYRRFLRQAGLSEADVLERIELDVLQGRLTREVAASAPPVTNEDVRRYYAEHRRHYRGVAPPRARTVIRSLLLARRQQRSIERFTKDFRSRYRALTVCAEGYVVAQCGNSGTG